MSPPTKPKAQAAPAPAPAHPPEDGLDPAFLEKVAPVFRALRAYSRLQVDGLANVPAGPALLACNHTGWLGLDYAFTALSVYDGLGRMPRGMAHEAWFKMPAAGSFARRVGLFKVTKDAMRDQLREGHLVMIFPEGEKGAFRPESGYTLDPFARGFVRVAMATQAPVVPVAILGGEEANPVGRRIESYEELLNLKGGLPIPKNILPKPVKWRIRFLPPLPFSGCSEADAVDHDRVHALAEKVRSLVQAELRTMKVERGHPYL
ncbi:MAG TPA: lysophospholipid acyltransferase family protein [Candidatus Thermoplasmatota archaeon]|nr:lysophospholipid acyltransferase family protein [Candidatus Thermoplasmatota archaeon]